MPKRFIYDEHIYTIMEKDMPYQTEFPFTRNGALQLYNNAQRMHIMREWNQHVRATKNYHYIKPFDEFTLNYVRDGGARKFSESNSELFFGSAVERQNELARDKWIDNKLHGDHKIYQTLDKFLNDDQGHLDN